jgi:hypothetical protein
MEMPGRQTLLRFHIDTNRINSKRKLECMNILEHWNDAGVIYIEMAERAQIEALQAYDKKRSKKAYTYIATETLAETADEIQLMKKIAAALFPDGIRDPKERNDVEIVFNAHKYYAILITDDGGSRRQPGGILGNRDKLRGLGIEVMRDFEAVELVKQELVERDKIAREISLIDSICLPDWVGKDLEILKLVGHQ